MSIIHNLPAADRLPGTGELSAILIASAFGSSHTKNNEAGNVLNDDQQTRWTSKGLDEFIVLELPSLCIVNRIDIEWDPNLSRTGYFSVWVFDTFTEPPMVVRQIAAGQIKRAMFTSITNEEGFKCNGIKIVCGGNKENDLNGITNVKLYGRQ